MKSMAKNKTSVSNDIKAPFDIAVSDDYAVLALARPILLEVRK